MVLKLRFVVVAVAVWLVAVAGVSVSAWVAIDRAGRDVTGASVSALRAGSVDAFGRATTPGPEPSRSDPTLKPSARVTTSPSPAKPQKPSAARSLAPPGSPAPPSSPSGRRASSPSVVTVRDRTVTVAGGQVSVRCTAGNISLRIAQPDSGWRVETDGSSGEAVEVTFKQGDVEDRGETHVRAVCSGGNPTFTVENLD